ncbi:hypothetical protein ACWKWC_10450, partial [Geodermatophilus nigrescens]
MELIGRVRAWALAQPHVLLVESPGTDFLRWSVEAELDRRRWPLALSPADADVLLVLGTPGPQLEAAIGVLWSQVPAPRARLGIRQEHEIMSTLDDGAASLVGSAATRSDDDGRPSPASLLAGGKDPVGGHEGMDHAG